MNLSRACTLSIGNNLGDTLSVGRVQTPTLAMVVERELAVRAFVPEDYCEVVATFEIDQSGGDASSSHRRYQGTWFRGHKPDAKAKRLPADGLEAQQIIARAWGGQARVGSRRAEQRRIPPPALRFDRIATPRQSALWIQCRHHPQIGAKALRTT